MNLRHGKECICRECDNARKLLAQCGETIRNARSETDRIMRDAISRVPPWMPLGGE